MSTGTGTEVLSDSAVRAARDVKTAVSRMRRRLLEVTGTSDLTLSQTAVLSRLSRSDAVGTSDLAAAEGVRPQSMASTLLALEGHGLVQRHPDPEDGRRQLITLTQPGRQRMDGRRAARTDWLSRAMQDHYTEQQRQTLITAMALLDRVIQLQP